jgi:2-polyprenyl-3-methyl-5-hydroxy-6-metoxy-1,4-benzoquinol methylase
MPTGTDVCRNKPLPKPGLLHCPYCSELISDGRLFGRSDEWRCGACDLIFKKTGQSVQCGQPPKDRYYAKSLSGIEVNGSRLRIYRHIVRRLGRNRKGSLLDVGSGCGIFLIEAQNKGWSVRGIEPAADQSRAAIKRYGLNIFRGTLLEFQTTDRYDAITFVNSLDLTGAPWEEVKKARCLLRPGGRLYLRFPNAAVHVWMRRLLSAAGLYHQLSKLTVFHKYSFSKRFVERLLRDAGFSEIRIFNSPFSDSFGFRNISNSITVKIIKQAIYISSEIFRVLSWGSLNLGTSLEVLAAREDIRDFPAR